MADVVKLQKYKIGVLQVLEVLHISFGTMEPKISIVLDLMEWYGNF